MSRKPHNHLEGYVCELKSKHPKLPGHFVIFDRNKTTAIDADARWVVMHMPSSHHVAIRTLKDAREIMKDMARGGDSVDLGQYEN